MCRSPEQVTSDVYVYVYASMHVYPCTCILLQCIWQGLAVKVWEASPQWLQPQRMHCNADKVVRMPTKI